MNIFNYFVVKTCINWKNLLYFNNLQKNRKRLICILYFIYFSKLWFIKIHENSL